MSSVFLRIEQTNNEDETVFADFDYRFRRSIVNNMAAYYMAIQRITLPTKSVQWLYMTDPDEYGVHVRMNGVDEGSSQGAYLWYPGYIPHKHTFTARMANEKVAEHTWLHNSQITNGANVDMSNPVSMKEWNNQNNRAIVENINRTICRAYLGALWNLEYSQPSEMLDHSLHSMPYTREADDGAGGMYPYSRVLTNDEMANGIVLGQFDFKPTSSEYALASTGWGNIAGVILRTGRIKFGLSLAGLEQNVEYTLVLVAPDGTRVNVGKRRNDESVYTTTWYSDGAVDRVERADQASDHHCLPIDPFIVLQDKPWIVGEGGAYADTSATWKLLAHVVGFRDRNNAMLASTGSVDNPQITFESPGDVSATLHAFASHNKLPTMPPVLHVQDDGAFSIYAQRQWLDKSVCSVSFAPPIARLLRLDSNARMFSYESFEHEGATKEGYVLSPPGEAIVDNGTPAVQLPNVGVGTGNTAITNLKLIEVVTFNVPVESEIQASSLVGENVLMTFIIQKSALDQDKLIYDYDGPDISSRKFPFTKNGPLESMRVSVHLVYMDGSRFKFPVPPGESAEIMIQLRRRIQRAG